MYTYKGEKYIYLVTDNYQYKSRDQKDKLQENLLKNALADIGLFEKFNLVKAKDKSHIRYKNTTYPISLSHSEKYLSFVIGLRGQKVGIDIEKLSKMKTKRLMDYYNRRLNFKVDDKYILYIFWLLSEAIYKADNNFDYKKLLPYYKLLSYYKIDKDKQIQRLADFLGYEVYLFNHKVMLGLLIIKRSL